MVGENIYTVIATNHGMERLKERGVDPYYISSACLALGTKLDAYNDSGNHIMLVDEGRDVATVITVENYTIVIIMALAKGSEVFAKSNTIIENFRLAQ
jgi:hypothetical protein